MSRGEVSQERGRRAREGILQFLEANGPSSAKVIGAGIKLVSSSVYSHTKKLVAAKKIHGVQQYTAGAPENIFHLGPAPVTEPVDLDVPVTRPRVQTWTPHHFRDPMVAAIHGHSPMEKRA